MARDGGSDYRRARRHHFQRHDLANVTPGEVMRALEAASLGDATEKLENMKPRERRVGSRRRAECVLLAWASAPSSSQPAPPLGSFTPQVLFKSVYKADTQSQNKRWLQRRLVEGRFVGDWRTQRDQGSLSALDRNRTACAALEGVQRASLNGMLFVWACCPLDR